MAANSGRLQFQKLAELRLNDAELLLANERFSSAYYLAGYAVELGLKACISKQIVADTIPEKSFIIKVHTHDFESLTGLAGLKGSLTEFQDQNQTFQAYWGIARAWSPDSRYILIEAIESQLMFTAISDPKDGIMQWIRQVW